MVAMASGDLDSVPDHINLPNNLQLKQSSIDSGCLGKHKTFAMIH